jgi:hypothetical protein
VGSGLVPLRARADTQQARDLYSFAREMHHATDTFSFLSPVGDLPGRRL